MKKCILTVGISASGKTTWAEEFVFRKKCDGEKWFNINRDDFRHEVFEIKTGQSCFKWSLWNSKWEKQTTERWKLYLQQVMANPDIDGLVISDTNLNPKTRNWLINMFEAAGYEVDLKLFPIEYEEAVKRDLARFNPVGSSVIAEQIEKYWTQFGERYIPNPSLPKAVIVDIDGTLAHRTTRNVYDWTTVLTDRPDFLVCDLVKGLKQQCYKIVIVSGRDEICREDTWQWLCIHLGFKPDELLMRTAHDKRKDVIVKKELFDQFIVNKYQVMAAIDDRPQVIMGVWKALGIQTLICGNPYHFF